MTSFSRRDFLKASAATSALAGLGTLPLEAESQTAASWVPLGNSGVKITRLAFGTGTMSGAVQRNLGQEGFNRLVRYAYDRGIRFFETSDSYYDMHRMLGIALQDIPRENYRLMTKVTTDDPTPPLQKIDELRRQARTDYFDILLLHWQHTSTWPEDTRPWQEAVLVAQHRGSVRARGASVHGLPALARVPDNSWLQIGMIRVNHKGVRMDTEDYMASVGGDVPEVVTRIHQTLASGKGVISMKLIGEGTFDRDDRRRAMRFAFRTARVDSVTVGYKSNAEIDEAIENLDAALA
ncbi:MAG TPA: aldo/keto reductase [Acidobacteriaceae bacterium]|nr:aldo/keto reductase [Acidobacteriaceae bacterium]